MKWMPVLINKMLKLRESSLLLGWGLISLSLLSSATSAWADAAAIKVGEADLVPELSLEFFGDDNVFRTNTSGTDATGVKVSPRATLTATKGTTSLSARYQGEFSSSGIEATDYDNHLIGFDAFSEFSKRSRADLSLSFARESEQPGQGVSVGSGENLERLNESNRTDLTLRHIYGVRNARGNLTTSLAIRDFAFTSDSVFTERSNFFSVSPSVRLSLRLTGSTRGFFQLGFRTFDFDVDESDRDEVNYAVGLEWAETEQFGGSAQIGAVTSDFPNSSQGTETNLTAQVGVYYSPVSFSRFDLRLDRELYNINDNFDASSTEAAIQDQVFLDWSHQWSSRLSHEINWNLDLIERDCTSDNDVSNLTTARLLLDVRRWIQVGAGVGVETRDFGGCDSANAGDEGIDFSKQTFSLFMNLTL